MRNLEGALVARTGPALDFEQDKPLGRSSRTLNAPVWVGEALRHHQRRIQTDTKATVLNGPTGALDTYHRKEPSSQAGE
jgi:hypothetical protein